MLKRIAIIFSVILFAMPAVALAATSSSNTNELVSLYAQVVQLLEQEIALLQQSTSATSLSIYPTTGVAPLFVTFIVNNPTGTESIDFGDGYTTGTQGCIINSLGWCDLTKPVAHEYLIPGTYTVFLYRHTSSTTVEYLSTSTIEAAVPSSTQYDPNL